MFEYDIFLSHAAADAERADEVRQALIDAGYIVYCDRYDDPNLDRTRINRATADVLRERMRSCKMLLFVVTASSAQSKWMPWELGFFDAARGTIVVYPVDEAAERAAKGQEYLSLYEVLHAGSLEDEVAARLDAAEPVAVAVAGPKAAVPNAAALEVIRRNAIDNIFGGGDYRATGEYGRRIGDVTRSPLDLDGVLKLQSDLAAAWGQLWLGMFLGKR